MKYKVNGQKKKQGQKVKSTMVVTCYLNEKGNMKTKTTWEHKKIEE